MKKIIYSHPIGYVILVVFCLMCVNVKAQTPMTDPGIGGAGVQGNGTMSDGSPVVPFDGGMSLILAASGIGYAVKRMKRKK